MSQRQNFKLLRFKRGLRDTEYLPFYLQGYGILSSLLPGILKFCLLLGILDI